MRDDKTFPDNTDSTRCLRGCLLCVKWRLEKDRILVRGSTSNLYCDVVKI
jgi:hypothetical protein